MYYERFDRKKSTSSKVKLESISFDTKHINYFYLSEM